MHKGKDCIGLSVISNQTGQMFGKISDIACSPDLDAISCLLVTDKTNNDLRECPPSWISSLGRDAVIVNTAELPKFMEKDEDYLLLTKVKGLHIVASDGTELGELVDILFKLPLCKVWGLEVSEGFIGDILIGRHAINKEAIKKISKDCILVDF